MYAENVNKDDPEGKWYSDATRVMFETMKLVVFLFLFLFILPLLLGGV